MKSAFLIICCVFLSCSEAPEIVGFDKERWDMAMKDCDDYRSGEGLNLLLESKEKILTKNQNSIAALLGSNPRQKLLRRNQKFFIYPLDCLNSKSLSIRFDALGRATEIRVVKN